MSKLQRIENVLIGLVMILCAWLMIAQTELGYLLIIVILGVSLAVTGIRYLIYFFSMARHMVGGRLMLYIGIFALDYGIFSLSLQNIPRIYVLLYLVGLNLVSGGIEILGAVDSRRQGGSWRLKFANGAVSVAIAVLCIFFRNSDTVMVWMYCIGLVYSAVCRIITALRRTAVVYIQ